MSKFWHTFGSVALVCLTAALPIAQHAISAHPLVTTVLGGVWAIIWHLLPSPLPQSGN